MGVAAASPTCAAGDRVPLALDQLVGEPQRGRPSAAAARRTGPARHHVVPPRVMTAELAELVGYFMGDGSLHAKGIAVVRHRRRLRRRSSGSSGSARSCFGLPAHVAPKTGLHRGRVPLGASRRVVGGVRLRQARAARGSLRARAGSPHIPDAILHSNDRAVYAAFLRGLFEADGTVTVGHPALVDDVTGRSSYDVQSLLLAHGLPDDAQVRRHRVGALDARRAAAAQHVVPLAVARRRSASSALVRPARVAAQRGSSGRSPGPHPADASSSSIAWLRRTIGCARCCCSRSHANRVSRRIATELFETGRAMPSSAHLLAFFYDTVTSAELGDEEFTFDLSVPENVTYVANGFVSHNTIGLMMDCDTTGIEPDLALTKAKKLVGGGTMFIVNQTIPRALRKLGYPDDQVDAIVGYIDEHKSIMGAPGFNPEHLPVFACSMGDNTIHYMGHVKMMAAAQPFLSGAISQDREYARRGDGRRRRGPATSSRGGSGSRRSRSTATTARSASRCRRRRRRATRPKPSSAGRADRRDDHRPGAGPPEAAAHPQRRRRSRSASPTATAT